MPSFMVSDTNSLYKTNVSYLDTEDNKWAKFIMTFLMSTFEFDNVVSSG